MERAEQDLTSLTDELERECSLADVSELFRGTLFHGTGRLARGYNNYDKSELNGTIVDVLERIFLEGIQPQVDVIARVALPVERTISLTRHRLYARFYAEEFGAEGEDAQSQLRFVFGHRLFWKKNYFAEQFKRSRTLKNVGWLLDMRKYVRERFSKQERTAFRDAAKQIIKQRVLGSTEESRLHKEHYDRWYANRAFAPGNHPVILGIDEDKVDELELPDGMKDYESRTGNVISPEDIKFVEVPATCVESIRESIVKAGVVGVNVIPMELGEIVCSQAGVSECLKPLP